MLRRPTTQDSLDNSFLSQEITSNTKCKILQGLWSLAVDHVDSRKSKNYTPYFAYYTKQCNTASHDNGRHLTARTHKDILDIAEQIKSGNSRDEIQNWLKSTLPAPGYTTAEMIDGSIDLTARLLLMMDIGDLKFGFFSQAQLLWTAGSLENWLHKYFEEPQILDHEHVKLEMIFNARNLVRIAGFDIQWTDNLADHLRIMSEDDKKVAIFHQASFLENQRDNELFPKGFIDETIRTLGLLLPQADPQTRKWYRKLSSTMKLDDRAASCHGLRAVDRHIEKFTFWRDRLIVLKQLFDEAEPTTITQWWCDRRNGVQWYTFWVAILVLILTLVFGLIQCIEGGIQAHMALAPPGP